MKKIIQDKHAMHHNHAQIIKSATSVKVATKLANDTTDKISTNFDRCQHGKKAVV